MAETKKVVFKTTGPHAGKTVRLGANQQYPFVDGKCELECTEDDAKKHAHVLKKYYGVVRIKPKGAEPTVEDTLPTEDEVDQDGEDTVPDPDAKPAGKGKGKKG